MQVPVVLADPSRRPGFAAIGGFVVTTVGADHDTVVRIREPDVEERVPVIGRPVDEVPRHPAISGAQDRRVVAHDPTEAAVVKKHPGQHRSRRDLLLLPGFATIRRDQDVAPFTHRHVGAVDGKRVEGQGAGGEPSHHRRLGCCFVLGHGGTDGTGGQNQTDDDHGPPDGLGNAISGHGTSDPGGGGARWCFHLPFSSSWFSPKKKADGPCGPSAALVNVQRLPARRSAAGV